MVPAHTINRPLLGPGVSVPGLDIGPMTNKLCVTALPGNRHHFTSPAIGTCDWRIAAVPWGGEAFELRVQDLYLVLSVSLSLQPGGLGGAVRGLSVCIGF